MPRISHTEERIENAYHVSWYIVAYKLIFGFTEFLLGIGITVFGQTALRWYRVYAAQELFEDPHDVLIRLTEAVIPNVLTHSTIFVLYLLLLGGAKIA